MAEEEDDHHQAPVNEIDKAAEAGDEMDAKRKGKGKKKKERKSKRTILSPSPPSTSGSKKRGRSKGSKDKRPRSSLVFKETGDDFTLHRLTVNPGEDLVKIMEKFNRHYKRRNFCIISVSGTASKAEFDDSPYPLKYEEEHLQLLSLSVGRIFKDNGDSQNREEKRLSASLSTICGTVIGGTLVGPLIAANPIHIIVGTFKRIIDKVNNIFPGESSTANQNINLASEDVGIVPENVSANPNISSASEDIVAGTDDQTMQQPETEPNDTDTDEYGDIIV